MAGAHRRQTYGIDLACSGGAAAYFSHVDSRLGLLSKNTSTRIGNGGDVAPGTQPWPLSGYSGA